MAHLDKWGKLRDKIQTFSFFWDTLLLNLFSEMPDAKNPRLAESAAAINEANNAIARQNCAIMRRTVLKFLKKWEYCAMHCAQRAEIDS